MANISLGQNGGVYGHRAISGASQYLPDASCILARSNVAIASDTWGAAALAALAAGEGFVANNNQDVNILFVGNTGNAYLEYYDPVAANWLTWVTFTDAIGHIIRAPMFMPWRLNANNAGSTAVKMWTMR